MRFSSTEEKMQWLKDTADKIWQMEFDRRACIMRCEWEKATSLLKAIKLAKTYFYQVSRTLKK